MPRCSVIIPVFNKASFTRQCLDALLTRPLGSTPLELIVVDDASTDMTAQVLGDYGDRIRVVKHISNQGFASACNDGAAVAKGEYLVLLNNDTIPQPDWLDALVRYADNHPAAAIVGSKMLFPDDTIQHAGMVICQDRFPRHIYTGFPADHPAVNKSRRFQLVTGGCMLLRRQVFEEAGGFDITFRNGFEDVDLCLRLGERGHEVHYCHESVLYHFECVSREGRLAEEDRNARIYLDRWGDRVRPDDLQYFLEDGLLGVEHLALYPIEFSISSLLGVVKGDGQERSADRLIDCRSRQVLKLLKENIRLQVRTQEAELQAAGNGNVASASGPAPSPLRPSPTIGERGRGEGAVVGGKFATQLAAHRPNGASSRPDQEGPLGVNVAGLFASEKGLGEAARATVRSLEAVGIPYALNNFTDRGSVNRDKTFARFSEENPYAVNLVQVNVDVLPEFLNHRGTAYLADRYNVGYWYWELSDFPREWYSRLHPFDEIWVGSNFSLDAISRVASVPVVRIPPSLPERLPTCDYPRAHFGLPEGVFILLFIFDLESYTERKNPLGLIRAFKKAFSPDDNVLLVLKCAHSGRNLASLKAINEAAAGANVRIIDGILSREEVNTLLHLSDCYVSLHRSEGFGLTMAEAMSLEKPVIATGYSANTDFMTPKNSFLVRYDLKEIEQDHGPYKKGYVWADPHTDHAAELMRYVYENPVAARKVGRWARQDILRHLHPQVVGGMIRQRLERIAAHQVSPSIPAGVGEVEAGRTVALHPSNGAVNGQRYRADKGPTSSEISKPRLLFRGQLHGQPSAPTGHLNSVILPVKNGAARLRELLPRIIDQRTTEPIEIIAVDSGSADDSVEVLRRFGATVLAIDPHLFNHGRTRSLAAGFAQGDILVFLNQSTLPANSCWLADLTAPLRNDPTLAGVSSRVLPRPDADLLTRRDVSRDPSASPQASERVITDWAAYRALAPSELKQFIHFDTISAAIRAEVFRRLPFREANFAEDLIWGKEALEAGLKIRHEPLSVVFHSHKYSFLEIFRRNFDDGLALRRIVGWRCEESQVLPMIAGLVRDDWRYLEQECRIDAAALERWRLIAALRRAAQVLGHWAGANGEAPSDLAALLSLTEQIRAGVRTEAAGWEV